MIYTRVTRESLQGGAAGEERLESSFVLQHGGDAQPSDTQVCKFCERSLPYPVRQCCNTKQSEGRMHFLECTLVLLVCRIPVKQPNADEVSALIQASGLCSGGWIRPGTSGVSAKGT